MSNFTTYKKEKKLKKQQKKEGSEKEKGLLNNLKAPVKITKNLIKKGYNHLDLGSSALGAGAGASLGVNPALAKVRANAVRASLISGPNSNPSLSRMGTGPGKGNLRVANGMTNARDTLVMGGGGRNPIQIKMDTNAFFEEEFDPHEYLEELLVGDQWTNLKPIYSALKETLEKSSLSLQSHVYRNYKEFVSISKEISQLETGMFELRDIVDELQQVGDELRKEVKNGRNKNSDNFNKDKGMSDNQQEQGSLDETNRKELAKLWKAVQGSQEYLPYVEDRRPLLESPGWKELDHSNFRFKRNAHFFLLTDSLLVATRAKRQTVIDIKANSASKMGLMARCCIKFSEMTLADVKDSTEVKDAFKILHKNEVYVFSAKSRDDKKKFLRGVARATSDYFRTLHQKALLETSKKVGESLEVSDNHLKSSLIKTGNYENPSVLTPDFWDSLDIALAHHQYKDAVDLLLEAKTSLKRAPKILAKNSQDILDLKQRIQTLTLILEKRTRAAEDKSTLKKYLQPMIQLGLIAEAQQSFLDSRHSQIQLRIKQLPLDGSTHKYISSLSQLIFGMVATTCRWHAELFEDRSVTSRLISWVRSEVEGFGTIYRNQLFKLSPPPQSTILRCQQAAEAGAKLLHQVGLDLNFQLDRLLAPPKEGHSTLEAVPFSPSSAMLSNHISVG